QQGVSDETHLFDRFVVKLANRELNNDFFAFWLTRVQALGKKPKKVAAVHLRQLPHVCPPERKNENRDDMQARSLMHPTAHRAPQPPMPDMLLSDRYRLEETIGKGATATVFRATDTLLGETVAVKGLLLDGVLSTPEARSCRLGFREEAISAMRLSHPMILRLHNYEVHPPWEFLVMEYVAGETLTQCVKRRQHKRLTAMEAMQIGIDCLEALQYA